MLELILIIADRSLIPTIHLRLQLFHQLSEKIKINSSLTYFA